MKIGIITDYSEPSIGQLLKIKEIINKNCKNNKVNIGYHTNGDKFLVDFFGKSKFSIVNSINLHCIRDQIISDSDMIINLSRKQVPKEYRV